MPILFKLPFFLNIQPIIGTTKSFWWIKKLRTFTGNESTDQDILETQFINGGSPEKSTTCLGSVGGHREQSTDGTAANVEKVADAAGHRKHRRAGGDGGAGCETR